MSLPAAALLADLLDGQREGARDPAPEGRADVDGITPEDVTRKVMSPASRCDQSRTAPATPPWCPAAPAPGNGHDQLLREEGQAGDDRAEQADHHIDRRCSRQPRIAEPGLRAPCGPCQMAAAIAELPISHA